MTWGFVSLFENRLFLVLSASKTDRFCRKVTLTISVTTNKAYAIKSLWNLFKQFLKAHYQFLFSNIARSFSQNYNIKKLEERIHILGYEKNYIGYSFWRGAITSARLVGLSKEEIQFLERWKSYSYHLYIETHPD